ncbi:VCBS repeat-containing protein [Thalassovita sp.]|uniref:FG-GAP repeat domain-containing protein n=1 Tax=Thalassovita sp. TaxID=1979401 RepID=UPI0029DE7EEF|nr:VCBS repeat-containing protein [Thalassovita sp.]
MLRGFVAALGLVLAPVAARADVVGAAYVRPVDRYHHDILGETPEWGALELRLADGRRLRFVLPDTHIFEDVAPRLADVDGDGAAEVIAVQTSLTLGARLTVWDTGGLVAATPYIGRSNRWLAPVGAADLDGDGKAEIAYVDRPHLARLLRIWRFEGRALVLAAEKAGLTNHRIGEAFITGGLRDCGGGPEMVTVNADWSRVMVSRFDGKAVVSRDAGPYRGMDSVRAVMGCR